MKALIPVLFGLIAWSIFGAHDAMATCDQEYSTTEFSDDLAESTRALVNMDQQSFMELGEKLHTRVPCLTKPISGRLVATVLRNIGTAHYFAGREQDAAGWLTSAIEADPGFQWASDEVPSGHPLREMYNRLKNAPPHQPEVIAGQRLSNLHRVKVFLDGSLIREPAATPNSPHFFQVVSRSTGRAELGMFIDGNRFPNDYIAGLTVRPETDRSGTDTATEEVESETNEIAYGDQSVYSVDRVRPPAKTPLLIAGGTTMVLGIGLYSASFVTHGKFQTAETTEDLLRYQTLNNSLVMASGVTTALGVAAGVFGMRLDGIPGVFVGGRF